MTNLDVRRHSELFEPHTFQFPVHIIGAGATGSWLALQLANLGISGEQIHVWDFDHVEEHNIPNQAFELNQVGMTKVDALEEIVHKQTGEYIQKHVEKYENQRLQGYVFLMVDSMAERKRIWEQSIKLKSAIQLLVEPRMGLDVGRIYNVEPMKMEQIRAYEDCFYSDDEAEVSACGTSMTVITSAMTIASWCARQLLNKHQGEAYLDNEILIDFKYNNLVATQWE